MKVVIQRVDSSSVNVNNSEVSSINNGLLLLWGVEINDDIEDVNILTEKILNLRIFSDEEGKMNKSIVDVGGSILLVSQFTLLAILDSMNKKGVKVSKSKIEILSKEINSELDLLDKEIKKITNKDFNLNSPKQLAEILYVDMGLLDMVVERGMHQICYLSQ